MNPEGKRYSAVVGNKTVTIETGRLAGQAGGALTLASKIRSCSPLPPWAACAMALTSSP
jgi:hypothetical protein